ncbi:MAG: hypothetical protein QOF77_2293 [Solirubrobacteraceae bacterium]|jgi:hypothetical protein|nr:hypothetical protein [Solirubrobacteraceae bacterium]
MPVTNSHSDEELPWTKPGMTGMKIKPTGRPSGVLAELAGMAENVGGLTEEERRARGGPEKLLVMSETPPHVAVTDETHNSSSGSVAFRAVDKAIGFATGGGRLVKKLRGR